MQRVLIIGPCGSGKSTLSRDLGARLNLPVIHMDQLGWLSGWVETDKEELRRNLQMIVKTDRWLIEGNYASTLHLRLPRTDAVIYLDFPIRLCLWRLLRRVLSYHGRTRPDMTDGCPERFNFEFLRYVMSWNWGPRLLTEERLKGQEDKAIRLQNPRELERWLTDLQTSSLSQMGG